MACTSSGPGCSSASAERAVPESGSRSSRDGHSGSCSSDRSVGTGNRGAGGRRGDGPHRPGRHPRVHVSVGPDPGACWNQELTNAGFRLNVEPLIHATLARRARIHPRLQPAFNLFSPDNYRNSILSSRSRPCRRHVEKAECGLIFWDWRLVSRHAPPPTRDIHVACGERVARKDVYYESELVQDQHIGED